MIEIVLANTDLARVRFAHPPVQELVASLRVLRDPGRHAMFGSWPAAVQPRLRRLRLDLLTALAPTGRYLPAFLLPPPTQPWPVLADQLAAPAVRQHPAQLRDPKEATMPEPSDTPDPAALQRPAQRPSAPAPWWADGGPRATAEAGGTTMADRSAQAVFDAPPPDRELKRLAPLLGTWTTQGHTQDSVYGPGVAVTSTETFRWLDGGYFLVQEYETTFGDEPTQRGVNFWGYDTGASRFRIIFFSNNGPFTEDGSRYEGTVAEGRLTFVGPARFQHELDAEGRIKTHPDGTISVAWWVRDEQGQWQPWMDNTFRKIRD